MARAGSHRWVTALLVLGLAGLLAWLQYRLWFGEGGDRSVAALAQQVEAQRHENDGLRQRNDALAAEVQDLKAGEAAVEERARSELGMIRPGETFYRVVEPESDTTRPSARSRANERRSALCRASGARLRMIWALIPAAGRGTRFGGDVPKQYSEVHGRPLIAYALDAVLAHPKVVGAVVALSADDPHWPGWMRHLGKPVLRCVGGRERADSVIAALHALPPDASGSLVLVHDAARPNLDAADLDRLIEVASAAADGAILAAPVRDTLKRRDVDGAIASTVPREALWRALTPQAFRADVLAAALASVRARGLNATDEATAMELAGRRPLLVEGRDDNIKVTTPADLAIVEFLLARSGKVAIG